MLRVKCVDAAGTSTLVEGKNYFAFPANESKTIAYISNFQKEGTNFGCFQMSRFKVLESSFEQLKWF